ncbi:hypothetical protein GQ457_13G023230 [Hibiscus cannabinus]
MSDIHDSDMAIMDEEVPIPHTDGLKLSRSTVSVIPRWHFKFEAAWLIEDSCEPEVQKLWVESSGFLPDRLRYMSRGLDAWFRKLKASRKFTTKSLTKRLEQLTELLPSDNVLEEMMEVKLALNLEADKSELYWEQRARANWLRYGDKNTSFFHRHASQRKRYNRICSLENENGQSCSSSDDMLHIAQEYFVSLFSSGDTADPSFILDGISHLFLMLQIIFFYGLILRRIALDPICPVCNLANETTEHVFRDCHIACLVWTQLGFVWPQYATLLPFKEWLSWLFDSFPMNRLVLLVITLWSLWYARNKKVHEANLQTPEQICAFIVSYCRELELIASKLHLISSTQNSLWQAPDPPLVKANFDASFSGVDRASWSGVVVRNSIGEIMGACRRFSPYVASAFMAEAYAALHAIDLLVDLGFDSAVIEGDSLTIIKKLQASSSDLSELSAIIFEVQAKAKTLRNCSFNFTSRASNQVAHIISKDFSLNSGDRFWVEEIPSSALQQEIKQAIPMSESKAVIGLKWEPKLPGLPFPSTTTSGSGTGTVSKSQNEPESSSLWKPNRQLVDGLFVPPNDPSKVNKLLRKQVKDTAGSAWFDMPAPTLTPELKKDLQLLKLRGAIDPKRHYKKDSKSKALPKYFQVGTVVESVTDYYSGRLTKNERKATLADELLSDPAVRQYRKRKVREIEERNRPTGNEKWKIKGRQTYKRAKQRRH